MMSSSCLLSAVKKKIGARTTSWSKKCVVCKILVRRGASGSPGMKDATWLARIQRTVQRMRQSWTRCVNTSRLCRQERWKLDSTGIVIRTIGNHFTMIALLTARKWVDIRMWQSESRSVTHVRWLSWTRPKQDSTCSRKMECSSILAEMSTSTGSTQSMLYQQKRKLVKVASQ